MKEKIHILLSFTFLTLFCVSTSTTQQFHIPDNAVLTQASDIKQLDSSCITETSLAQEMSLPQSHTPLFLTAQDSRMPTLPSMHGN